MGRNPIGRRTFLVAGATLLAVVLFAGLALGHIFRQKTHITASFSRVSNHRVMIEGNLTTVNPPSHKAYCTHGRPVHVTKTSTGKTKTVKTDNTGHYEVTFRLGMTQHSDFKAQFPGRTGGVHPHRHICKRSNEAAAGV